MIENFYKSWSPTIPSHCPRKSKCKSRRNAIDPEYSPFWHSDKTPCHMVTVLNLNPPFHKQCNYAIAQGYTVLYARICNECKLERKKNANSVAQRKVTREENRGNPNRPCENCKKEGGKDACGFAKDTSITCVKCQKYLNELRKRNTQENRDAAPQVSSFALTVVLTSQLQTFIGTGFIRIPKKRKDRLNS